MNPLLRLGKGSPGKPLHPPLTDASIGAYTVGVAALIAGKAGLQTPEMAHTALIAISLGLLLAAPTALTGLLDWFDIPRGTPARSAATIHLIVMVTTTVLFALTWLAQRPGYDDDEIRTSVSCWASSPRRSSRWAATSVGRTCSSTASGCSSAPTRRCRRRSTRSGCRRRTRRRRRGRSLRSGCHEPLGAPAR